tara:strand:- start:4623 stop:4727 length:105 start_codon:yes stop_codon:yes gene_type:complete
MVERLLKMDEKTAMSVIIPGSSHAEKEMDSSGAT